MITNVEYDYPYWTITIAEKYTGTSMFIIFAVYKAMWNFILDLK